ncbi:sensor histidine kinase [Sandarakinorhabdus sp. DWP1-3-1]|uniref:sensor histidine kinase n=1 Tax=Sandarakinorhabdus sp. DWP1-3-1 TaxID=2804627 RepID=UPI003CF86B88
MRQLQAAIDAADVALWSWNVDDDRLTMCERAFSLWGVPSCEQVTFEELSARIHPADRDRVRQAFAATRSMPGSYEMDFRITRDDELRWISARGHGNDEEIRNRVMFGVFLDITERKQAEENHELLAGEMSHRVKNLLAIASGLTTITSRSTTTAAEMAGDLTRRLTALGRAHDLVRPLPGAGGGAALLGDLFTVLLAPYDDMGAALERVRVAVPRMSVGQNAATTLALVVHELATNSLKYGSLSSPDGSIDIQCSTNNSDVVVVWTERGGPATAKPSDGEGFGSKLVQRSMAGLGGTIAYDWASEGVVARLSMREDRLAN